MAKSSLNTPGAKHDQGIHFIAGLSQVTQPSRVIRVSDLYDPKPTAERKPVKIRPPSPRSPSPREPVYGRSLSCDPTPKPIMRRRAQSLPSTPSRRCGHAPVQVRFADALGLELEEVKVFKAGEDPQVPFHVLSRLLINSELSSGKNLEISLPYFQPGFPEDLAAQPGFADRLRRQAVCLERIICSDVGIMGTAQVLNLDFEKDVTVRYSFTDWRSDSETRASWVASATCNHLGLSEAEVFRFRLPVPPFILQPGAVLEFAIRFRVKRFEFWDNNDGMNYKLTCHNYKLTVPKECEDSMVHFT